MMSSHLIHKNKKCIIHNINSCIFENQPWTSSLYSGFKIKPCHKSLLSSYYDIVIVLHMQN